MSLEDRFESIYGKDGDGPDFSSMGLPEGVAVLVASALGVPGGFGRSQVITGDEVAFHDDPKILLPRGMTWDRAHRVLYRLEEEAENVVSYDQKFRYRPNDGAYATAKVLQDRYGMVLGESIDMGFFGTRPPESRSISIGVNEWVQVPWGMISIPALEGVQIQLCDRHPDPDYGAIFCLHVEAPKKYKDEVKAIFDGVEEQLRTNSIYRGKAVRGTDRLEFVDLSTFNPSEIIFSDYVTEMLEGTTWAVLEHTEALRNEGVRLKRTILLHGKYGTGKTSAAERTAQIAVENGWTVLMADSDDDVVDVLRTAKLYEPALVIVEDIDVETASGDDSEMKRILEAYDGITAKGGQMVVVMTTNHLDRIHKGMLRPGRFDAVVEIDCLDRNGVEKLIKEIVPNGKLAKDIDFDAIYQAMDGFYPAFVREALERAKTFAVARLKGKRNYVLATEDLVKAAQSLQSQLKALNEAAEGEKLPTLDTAIAESVRRASQEAVHGAKMVFDSGAEGELCVPALNGKH